MYLYFLKKNKKNSCSCVIEFCKTFSDQLSKALIQSHDVYINILYYIKTCYYTDKRFEAFNHFDKYSFRFEPANHLQKEIQHVILYE